MKKAVSFFLFLLILIFGHSISFATELPKIAVWDLAAQNTSHDNSQALTSF
jgi:hypothetical protein